MPNRKISELSTAGALAGNELVEVVKGGANVQTTTQDIANLAPGGGGGGSWGSITGTLSSQTDLQNALNDKADAGVTLVTDTGAYTLQASDLTLINAGATLIIDGDGTGDLTVPLNATVAFPIGTMIGVRDYDNVVATGGVTITGSSGDLAIPSGMTATLEKTGTNTWLLHNGSASSGGGTWGSINGTLSNQTDLQTTLDAKINTSDRVLGLKFSDMTTPIVTGTNKISIPFPYSISAVQEIWAGLDVAQGSGSIFTIDVNKNGTTMLSTKITIDNGESTSLTAAAQPVISVTTITKGDKISIDIDQVGNGTAIGGTIWIRG